MLFTRLFSSAQASEVLSSPGNCSAKKSDHNPAGFLAAYRDIKEDLGVTSESSVRIHEE
jgi:hypothetical protein